MPTPKTKRVEKPTAGEQLDLIDVSPKEAKEIIPLAKKYKAAVKNRLMYLKEETDTKEKLLEMIKQANLQRLDDGSIKFHCKGLLITVVPRDEKITVKEDAPEE